VNLGNVDQELRKQSRFIQYMNSFQFLVLDDKPRSLPVEPKTTWIASMIVDWRKKMGNWVIHLEGHGMHDNGKDQDIDDLLRFFVKQCKEMGQDVYDAKLTVGSVRKLVNDEWKYQ